MMLATDRQLEEMDPRALRAALAERNDAFRADLQHEQRSLTPTILGAVGIAVSILIGTIGLLFLLHTVMH